MTVDRKPPRDELASPTPSLEANGDIPDQLRNETIAYALQGAAGNILTNFFEPYLGYRVQKYHSSHHPNGGAGTYLQNLGGEFSGDVIGAGTLILSELVAPKQLHAFTRTARSWIDPLYETVARNVIVRDCSAPDYEKKVQNWKTFQERNFVRSAIMAVARVGGNIAVQKTLFKNPSPAFVIFEGKLLSTAITTALGLGTRFAFPTHMEQIDKWLAKNVVAPVMDKDDEDGTPGHAQRVLEQKNSPPLIPAR